MISLWLVAAVLFAFQQRVLASFAFLLALVVTAGVALLAAGTRVLLTDEGAFVRVGFLQYFMPWREIRGFELDSAQKPSTVYMIAWHQLSSTYRRFEVLPLGGLTAKSMLLKLEESAAPHLQRTASDRPA